MNDESSQLPGTSEEEMAAVKFEGTNTETSSEFKIGDTVQVAGSGVICGSKDELKKDDTRRHVYWVRLDGLNLK